MAHRKPNRKPNNIQRIQLCKRVPVEIIDEKSGNKYIQMIPEKDSFGKNIKINKFKFIEHTK